MKNDHGKSKLAIRTSIIGAILLLAAMLLTGFLGISKITNHFRESMGTYWAVFKPGVPQGKLSYVTILILFIDIVAIIYCLVSALVKKKEFLLIPSVGAFLSAAFIPFLIIFLGKQVAAQSARRIAFVMLLGAMGLTFLALLLFLVTVKPLFAIAANYARGDGKAGQSIDEEEVRRIVREYAEDLRPVQEVGNKKASGKGGLSQEEVRKIVEEALEAHKEELHTGVVVAKEEPAPAPVEEEPEEDEDDEVEIEEVEEVDEQGNVVKIKRKKRVPFENRLRKSEFDLRHKYYDLRDYIKWYGLNNRISIPGDTFSFKRRKYAFITIVGKHIKFYIALDPAKYEDSPVPVERATAKKYAETPCVLRIKSDLSYRRAKGLVDDLMKEAGFAKPEGEEPKETQH